MSTQQIPARHIQAIRKSLVYHIISHRTATKSGDIAPTLCRALDLPVFGLPEHQNTEIQHPIYLFVRELARGNLKACGLDHPLYLTGTIETPAAHVPILSPVELYKALEAVLYNSKGYMDPEAWERAENLMRQLAEWIVKTHPDYTAAKWIID